MLEFAEIRFQEAFGTPGDAVSTLLERVLLPEELLEFGAQTLDFFNQGAQRLVYSLAASPTEIAVVQDAELLSLTYYSLDTIPKIWLYRTGMPPASFLGNVLAALNALKRPRGAIVVDAQSDRLHDICERLKRLTEPTRNIPSPMRNDLLNWQSIHVQSDESQAASLQLAYEGEACDYHISPTPMRRVSEYSDVHALLFWGHLDIHWAGRKIDLGYGLIFPFLEQCLALIRSGLDAFEFRRPLHQRHAGRYFSAGLRMTAQGTVHWMFSSAERGSFTVSDLPFVDSAAGLLNFSARFVRVLTQTMPSQSRNLRLNQFMKDITRLQQTLGVHEHVGSFINQRTDALRTVSDHPQDALGDSSQSDALPLAEVQYVMQWRSETQGLDTSVFFLTPTKIVTATPDTLVGLDRQTGRCVWRRSRESLMLHRVGPYVLSVHASGDLEFNDPETGEVALCAQAPALFLSPLRMVYVALRGLPSTLVSADRYGRVLGLDGRTGHVRWRYASRHEIPVHIARSGRVLCVVAGDGSVEALDVLNGEVLWRYSDAERVKGMPMIAGPYVIVSTEGKHYSRTKPPELTLIALDVLSGSMVWRSVLAGDELIRTATTPMGVWAQFTQTSAEGAEVLSALINTTSGNIEWLVPMDDASEHAEVTIQAQMLVLRNSDRIRVYSLSSGRTLWTQRIALKANHAPRFLKPLVHKGALWVSAKGAHRLSLETGKSHSPALAEDMIVDRMAFDEQGCVYLAEESGLIRAYRCRPRLRLIKA